MTNTTDGYEGWTNRETWALNLHLYNDQGLYEMTRERVADAVAGARRTNTLSEYGMANMVGRTVLVLWDEVTDPRGDFAPLSPEIIDVITDVGSVYRVDWDQIGNHWLDGLDES